jgi:rfaE bifunctional protein nucleotidyltransferase chain/domain/rfaE bifunctional protein kinase chain/domain
MKERLVVVGDALLDREIEGRSERLCPDAPVPVVDELDRRPRPGGAGLAATLAAAAGAPVTLVTALGTDPPGVELGRELVDAGVDLVDLGLEGSTPEKIRVLDSGRPLLRLDRGGGGEVGGAGVQPALGTAIATAGAILVSDYGHGVAAHPGVRAALSATPARLPLVWDPHPHGPRPIEGVTLATPNLNEAVELRGLPEPGGEEEIGRLAFRLVQDWKAGAVCVTRGGDGALLASADGGVWSYGLGAVDGDPCGAGDMFAAEVTATLVRGGSREEAVRGAVEAAGRFVAAGGARAAVPRQAPALLDAGEQGIGRSPTSIGPAVELARRVHADGGTVVATGGCFDLLHTGHLRSLEAARSLGDSLIVLLNGDDSVRRLKGEGRPLVQELERAAILKALRCVDEVAIFDEESPAEALRLLRPDVWAKGGDYAARPLPEAEALPSWGGRVAILPQVQGRSTTRLIERMG